MCVCVCVCVCVAGGGGGGVRPEINNLKCRGSLLCCTEV